MDLQSDNGLVLQEEIWIHAPRLVSWLRTGRLLTQSCSRSYALPTRNSSGSSKGFPNGPDRVFPDSTNPDQPADTLESAIETALREVEHPGEQAELIARYLEERGFTDKVMKQTESLPIKLTRAYIWAVFAIVNLAIIVVAGINSKLLLEIVALQEELFTFFYLFLGLTLLGSLIGLVWAFFDGLIGGAIFAWLYNAIATCCAEQCSSVEAEMRE